jgi:hypothetical protein
MAKTIDGVEFSDGSDDTLADVFPVAEDNKVDERITIAGKNKGSVILTPKQAIKMEKWVLKHRKTYLDGTPIFHSDTDNENAIPNIKRDTYNNRLDPMTKVITFSDIDDPLELKIKASQYLLNSLKYPAEITASSADLHWVDVKWETFKLCQLVKVVFPGWKSDYKWEKSYMSDHGEGLLRIEKMEIDIDKSTKKLTLGTPKRKELTEITREIKEEAEKKDNRTTVISQDNYDALFAHDNDKIYYIPLGEEVTFSG